MILTLPRMNVRISERFLVSRCVHQICLKTPGVKQCLTKQATQHQPQKSTVFTKTTHGFWWFILWLFCEKTLSFEFIPWKRSPGYCCKVETSHQCQFQKNMTVFNPKNSKKIHTHSESFCSQVLLFFHNLFHQKLHVLADGNTWNIYRLCGLDSVAKSIGWTWLGWNTWHDMAGLQLPLW